MMAEIGFDRTSFINLTALLLYAYRITDPGIAIQRATEYADELEKRGLSMWPPAQGKPDEHAG